VWVELVLGRGHVYSFRVFRETIINTKWDPNLAHVLFFPQANRNASPRCFPAVVLSTLLSFACSSSSSSSQQFCQAFVLPKSMLLLLSSS